MRLAVAVPVAPATSSPRYVNTARQLFFASRLLMGLLGLVGVVWLSRAPIRGNRALEARKIFGVPEQ